MYDMNPHNFSRLTSFFLYDNSININKKSTVKTNFLAPFFLTFLIFQEKKVKINKIFFQNLQKNYQIF